MAISTSMGLNRLTLSDILRASSCLLNLRNSKGRTLPLHLRSAPGVGKSMQVAEVCKEQARENPGQPYGMGIINVGNYSPTDAAGFVLFDTLTHPEDHPFAAGQSERVATFTRPASFTIQRVFFADPNDPTFLATGTPGADIEVRQVRRDVNGQPIFPGSIVACPFTGARVAVDRGLFLLDEFMQGDAEVRKVFAPFMDEGRVATHELPPGFSVWAASNRARDASGTGKALAFLTNRECGIEVDRDMRALLRFGMGVVEPPAEPILPLRLPLTDDAGRFVRRPWHPVVMAYAEQNEETLFAGVPTDPSEPYLTPRSLEALANWFDLMLCYEDSDPSIESAVDGALPALPEVRVVEPNDDPDRNRIFTAVAAGIVGSDNAAQFKATIELFGEVPRLAEMVNNPTKAHISDKKDAQLIAAYVAADGMTLANGNNIIRYAQRLHPSFLANVVVRAVVRNGELLMVSGVAKYLQENPTAMHRMIAARASAAKASGRTR